MVLLKISQSVHTQIHRSRAPSTSASAAAAALLSFFYSSKFSHVITIFFTAFALCARTLHAKNELNACWSGGGVSSDGRTEVSVVDVDVVVSLRQLPRRNVIVVAV